MFTTEPSRPDAVELRFRVPEGTSDPHESASAPAYTARTEHELESGTPSRGSRVTFSSVGTPVQIAGTCVLVLGIRYGIGVGSYYMSKRIKGKTDG